MTDPVIIDAGPALNFLSIRKERILYDVVGATLSAPETVRNEVLRKARNEERFEPAGKKWLQLEQVRRIHVLSDDVTDDLNRVVQRIDHMPMDRRFRDGKDLGESLVIAHAVVAAERGQQVVVIIDEHRAAAVAIAEAGRLQRLLSQGQAVGSIALINTPRILERAAGRATLPDKAAMRTVYNALRKCDDGLVDIAQTNLLSPALWTSPRP